MLNVGGEVRGSFYRDDSFEAEVAEHRHHVDEPRPGRAPGSGVSCVTVRPKRPQARRAQLEQELAGLQQARADLDGQYVREQQAAQESRKRIAELEKQLSQSAAEAKQQATSALTRPPLIRQHPTGDRIQPWTDRPAGLTKVTTTL